MSPEWASWAERALLAHSDEKNGQCTIFLDDGIPLGNRRAGRTPPDGGARVPKVLAAPPLQGLDAALGRGRVAPTFSIQWTYFWGVHSPAARSWAVCVRAMRTVPVSN